MNNTDLEKVNVDSENLSLIDATGEQFSANKEDFSLVQMDTKIHDTKFDTKPTTFAKDAFKRFCKNKSSVVGAFIIGILILLALIVPFASPFDVVNVHPYEKFLEPKLFNAGTGFWDGTKRVKKIALVGDAVYPDNDTYNNEFITNIVYYTEGETRYCDFTYDTYGATYGTQTKKLDVYYLKDYVNRGLCDFDFVNPSSFVKLKDECPIERVVSYDGENAELVVEITMYKYYGYSHMPRFLFGTTDMGKDLFKSSFIGLRSSLAFAVFIAVVCFAFGLCWGAVSGYFGGNVDLFLERLVEILGGVPLVIIVTLFRLHLGDALWVFCLALCVTGWISTSARTRTQFYRFKGREYVLASRTLGAKDSRLIFKHILPNALGTIVTSSVLMIPSLIFTEASLAYLGLGLQGGHSFGTILSENQQFLEDYPHLIVFPAVIISLLMISFNLFGNGLRDALNPSLKGSE